MLFWVTLCAAPSLLAADISKTQLEFFENKIRPLFANNCYKCHSQEATKIKGGLLLDSREGWFKGGDSGPAVVPGYPEKSLLIKAVRYTDDNLQMPPKGEKLSDTQVADLVAWVKMGAPDPRVAKLETRNSKLGTQAHWAFQPVKPQPIPASANSDWAHSPIDHFILAKLEEKGMKPSPLADKRALLRRATFDLTGLPPTPEELQQFLADESPNAFARLVDRLLDSPRYGERWGRYWLDIARYADTKGEVRPRQEDFRYPYAWTYRDYVIQAFNNDMPYNQFIVEQLAADKLPPRQDRSYYAAMGFLILGDRFNGNKNDVINDRIDVVTKGFLGLTVTCARCHDHKFDPIPTKDYYSLYGIFASSTEPKEGPLLAAPTASPHYADFQTQLSALFQELKTLQAEARGKRRGMEMQQLRQQQARLRSRIADLEMTHPGAPARGMVLVDGPEPRDYPVFIRGEAENKGAIVPRRFLEVLSGPNRPRFTNGSGRLELAHAIINKANPLTARVLVNRLWLHHFGEGLVTTPDDLGHQSAPPSHAELLDYLAKQFMDGGWSIKALHRLIMNSSTYQQSSANNPRYAQIDPNNRLLWRANVRRLEFEALRDSLLALGGKLDLTMGGHALDITAEPYSTRRSIYAIVDRSSVPEMFNHFDFANPDMSTGKRHETIVPPQALFLMNSPLVVEQARNLVARPDFHAKTTDLERIQLLYELVYQRVPTAVEIKLGEEFIAESPGDDRPNLGSPARRNRPGALNRPPQPKPARGRSIGNTQNAVYERAPLHAWEKYAHALLQANEAAYVN